MFKKNITVVFVGLIISSSVYSNNKLGMLTLNSKRHEPLNATITIKKNKGDDLKDLKVKLGSLVEFYRYNLEPSYLSSNLSFKVKTKNKDEKIIHISSKIPVSSENFNFVIKFYSNDNKYYGAYQFRPPVVDSMENVDILVCNIIDWDKNKECMKNVNTSLAFMDSISSQGNMSTFEVKDINPMLLINTINKPIENKKEIDIQNKEEIDIQNKEEIDIQNKEEIDIQNKEEIDMKNKTKKIKIQLMKNLKPHLYKRTKTNNPIKQKTKEAQDENIKLKLREKENESNSLKKGILKFSEIIKDGSLYKNQ